MSKQNAPRDLFRHFGRAQDVERQYLENRVSRGNQAGSSGTYIPNDLEREFFEQGREQPDQLQQQMQKMKLGEYQKEQEEYNQEMEKFYQISDLVKTKFYQSPSNISINGKMRTISYNGRSITEPDKGLISQETLSRLNLNPNDPMIEKFNNEKLEKIAKGMIKHKNKILDILQKPSIKINNDGTRTISFMGRTITEPNNGKIRSATLRKLNIGFNNPVIQKFNENYILTSEFENEIEELSEYYYIHLNIDDYILGKSTSSNEIFQRWLNGASPEEVILRLVDKAVQINDLPKIPVIQNSMDGDYASAQSGILTYRNDLTKRNISNLIICYFLAKMNNVKNPYRDFLRVNYPQIYSFIESIQIGHRVDPWVEFTNVQIIDYFDIVDFLKERTDVEPPLTRQFVAQLFLARQSIDLAFYDDFAILDQIKFGDIRTVYEILNQNELLEPWVVYHDPNDDQSYIWASWKNILTTPTDRKMEVLKEMFTEREEEIYLPRGFNLDQIISDFRLNQPNRWIPIDMERNERILFSEILDRLFQMKEEGLLKKRDLSKL